MNNTLDHVKLDVKTLLVIVVTVVAGLVGALCTVSLLYLNAKFDSVDTRFEDAYTYLESRFESQDKYLKSRFDRVDENFDSVNARIDKHEIILNNIRDRVASIEGGLERNSPDVQASAGHSPVIGGTL